MHTEKEATKLWCPKYQTAGAGTTWRDNRMSKAEGQIGCCIGSACMAWRWRHPTAFRGEEYLTKNHPLTTPNDWVSSDVVCDIPRGYCGLAGKPE